MTTLEEMLETYRLAWEAVFDPKQAARKALEAVIEKHVGPMLAGAVTYGIERRHVGRASTFSRSYAERVISQLKASPNGK